MAIYSSHKKVLLFLFGTALLIGLLVAATELRSRDNGTVACTVEAKLCPDGSYVGRTEPLCEFAACPEVSVPADWKTQTDNERGVSFRYPEQFSTTYIRALDWPPRIALREEPFMCTEAGSEIERAGRTESRMINGIQYCVTTVAEGAAGSIYTQYAYAWSYGAQTRVLTFSTRAPQCGNYPDAERVACEAEQNAFDLDTLIGRIAGTVVFE